LIDIGKNYENRLNLPHIRNRNKSGVGKRNETERNETEKTENFQKRNETERKKFTKSRNETKRKAIGNETKRNDII
jgi:hypothetical protein